MASIPPKMAQAHAARLKDRGVGHLDAPVSGGSVGAAEGSLAIMAGGEKADFDRAEAAGVFKPMGRASYIGPAGRKGADSLFFHATNRRRGAWSP